MLENWQTLNYLQKNVNHTSSRSQDDKTEDSCHERQGCGEGESSVSEGKYYRRNNSKFRNIKPTFNQAQIQSSRAGRGRFNAKSTRNKCKGENLIQFIFFQ